MNKSGQFFLIAAVVIIIILIGLGAIYNFVSINKEDSLVYDLSKEISYESYQVIDNGFFNRLSEEQISNNLKIISGNYSDLYRDSEIFIIYGDATNPSNVKLYLLSYTKKDSGEIGISDGGEGSSEKIILKEFKEEEKTVESSYIELKFGDDTNLNFDLKKGKNFYAVIKREKNEETTIAQN